MLPSRAASLGLLVALAAVAAPACSPPSADDAPATDEAPVAEEAAPDLPGGYDIRLDSERSDPGEFRIQPGEGENAPVRVTTGPAGIAWRPGDEVDRDGFRVRAAFVLHGAPVGYREAFGIFVGGRDLGTPDQEYTYLLVRGTGDFLIKRRLGETTETMVDWTAHPAVATVAEEGDSPRNVLSVEVGGGETRFLVNDAVVHRMPTPEARPHGIAGLRVNHRLDVEVASWVVEPLPDGAPS